MSTLVRRYIFMQHRVYILMGGNLGDVPGAFKMSIEQMGQKLGRVSACSPMYLSQAWGMEEVSPFYNQVVCLETSFKPEDVMDALLDIEKGMGRVRVAGQMLSRTLDLDMLLFDRMVIESEHLQIPHPRMHMRRFVLQPLNDIASEAIHPVFQQSIKALLSACQDPLSVEKISEGTACPGDKLQDAGACP